MKIYGSMVVNILRRFKTKLDIFYRIIHYYNLKNILRKFLHRVIKAVLLESKVNVTK